MKALDKTNKILNIVLGVLHLPMSLFSWLLTMASEGTIGATNPIYITLLHIVCVVAFAVPVLCVLGLVLSVIFRKKGHALPSLVIQFVPLGIFLLNVLLLAIAERLPSVI